MSSGAAATYTSVASVAKYLYITSDFPAKYISLPLNEQSLHYVAALVLISSCQPLAVDENEIA